MRGWAELPVAAVPGFAARWLLVQMRRGPVTGAEVRAAVVMWRSQGRPDLAVQLEVAWAQLKLAAREWDDAAGQLEAFASESGEAKAGGSVGPSGQSEEIATKEAAVMLGVSAQRVGQMVKVGTLAGRRVGGSLMVDRASVEALVAARRAS